MRNQSLVIASLSALLVASASLPALTQDASTFTPVTDEILQNPPDGDWLMYRRTLNHQGFSPLSEITKDNVGSLQLVWSRALSPGTMEGTPLVHNGVMYMPQSNSVIEAYDATTGDLIWEYRRQMPADLTDYVQLNDIVRGLAIWEDKIIHTTADGYLIALNAQTGALEWETQISDYKTATNWQTSPPIIANGKALSGRSCEPEGGPAACFLAAHDLSTGEELWRTYTIPRPGEPGDETWGNVPYESRWHIGSWITPSYDPELNLAYFGTSVTSPYTKFIIGSEDQDAEHLYQTSTLAIDADSGEIKWYQQHIRDQWDLDHPFERILVDTQVAPDAAEVKWISPDIEAGKEYRVMTGIPGKTGIFYSIDRETGKFLWARETVEQNTVLDIDTSNGRATMNSELFFTSVDDEHFVCPSYYGGKDWYAGAYSPQTNAIYYPLQNTCMTQTPTGDEPLVDELGMLDTTVSISPGTENLGTLRGISVETGDELWKYEQRAAMMSVVATGGGLLFAGDVNRRFRAFDQETGDVLWQTILGGPVGGFPISFEAGGKQYVAVAAGNFLVSGGLLGLTPEIKVGPGSNQLYVFALPQAD